MATYKDWIGWDGCAPWLESMDEAGYLKWIANTDGYCRFVEQIFA